MSQENVEQLIRRLYDRWNTEGIRAIADEFFDAQVEYRDDTVWPGGGTHIGRSAVIARFREVIDVLGISESVVERVADAGQHVVWVIRATGRSPGAHVPHEHTWGYVGRIEAGKLVYFQAYHRAEEALKAVGLEE